MRSFLAPILVAATVLTAVTARADDDSDAPRTKSEPQENWYGWQTLSTDGAALALPLAAGATTRSSSASNTLAFMSLGTYALGGPIVHLAHGRAGTAAGDLVIRLTVPVAAAVLGALIGAVAIPASSCEGDGPCGGELPGAVLGLGAGVITASIVDAAAFGYEPEPPKAQDGLRIIPSVAIVPQQGREGSVGTIGATGSF